MVEREREGERWSEGERWREGARKEYMECVEQGERKPQIVSVGGVRRKGEEEEEC